MTSADLIEKLIKRNLELELENRKLKEKIKEALDSQPKASKK